MNHLATTNQFSRKNPPSTVGWDDHARCKGHRALFFRDSPGYDPKVAKAMCQLCPCLAACLDDTLAHESGDARSMAGVRAGYEPAEIVKLIRRRRSA